MLGTSETFITSGVDFLANYFLEKYYKKEANVEDSLKLVGQAIYDTQKINGNVGGDISLFIIDKIGARQINETEYFIPWEDQEIQKIIYGP